MYAIDYMVDNGALTFLGKWIVFNRASDQTGSVDSFEIVSINFL